MQFSRASSPRGFTLIELLVVIAIIGILSSVVLAGLYVARLKSADAGIKSNLHTIQTAMELFYDQNLNYGVAQTDSLGPRSTIPGTPIGVPFQGTASVRGPLQAALDQGGAASIRYAVGVNGATYAVAVHLKGDSANWLCMDSTNNIKLEGDVTGANMSSTISAKLAGGGAAAVCP